MYKVIIFISLYSAMVKFEDPDPTLRTSYHDPDLAITQSWASTGFLEYEYEYEYWPLGTSMSTSTGLLSTSMSTSIDSLSTSTNTIV